MKRLLLNLLLPLSILMTACSSDKDAQSSAISEETIKQTLEQVKKTAPQSDDALVAKGVKQAAALWKTEDGSQEDFTKFVLENIAKTPAEKETLFNRISYIIERLYGTSNQLTVELQKPLHLAGDEPIAVDYLMGAYTPFSHLSDDLFANKFAFITIINFPNFSLAEKNAQGEKWSRLEWAYARLGDVFTSRIPAEITADGSE